MSKPLLLEFHCESGHTFQAPGLPDSCYGEFLLRDEAGMETAYLDAFVDATYQEVSDLLAQHPRLRGWSKQRQAEALRQVYGEAACDPVAGRPVHIGLHPACPVCATTVMRSWSAAHSTGPRLAPVTHDLWRSLGPERKAALLDEVMARRMATG